MELNQELDECKIEQFKEISGHAKNVFGLIMRKS